MSGLHEGNGKAAFIVEPATTDKQVEAQSPWAPPVVSD
jgi:hypothetical protein